MCPTPSSPVVARALSCHVPVASRVSLPAWRAGRCRSPSSCPLAGGPAQPRGRRWLCSGARGLSRRGGRGPVIVPECQPRSFLPGHLRRCRGRARHHPSSGVRTADHRRCRPALPPRFAGGHRRTQLLLGAGLSPRLPAPRPRACAHPRTCTCSCAHARVHTHVAMAFLLRSLLWVTAVSVCVAGATLGAHGQARVGLPRDSQQKQRAGLCGVPGGRPAATRESLRGGPWQGRGLERKRVAQCC